MYLEDFNSKEDIVNNFAINEEVLKDAKILLAWYGGGSYDGSAFVLIDRGGQLYEVNGCHCSCYGLEDQWEEEETNYDSLIHRINNGGLGSSGYYSGGSFGNQLKGVLYRWRRKQRVGLKYAR